MTIIAVDRFNAAHPWSHNERYAAYVLAQARAVRRAGGRVAADVGCGTGALARRLSDIFPAVVGIEADEATAAIASREARLSPGLRIEGRRFEAEPAKTYDLIVFAASLHHMPLRETLLHARIALRPGGRIVIVGVANETRRDIPLSVISSVLNPIIGIIRHPSRATRTPEHMSAPTSAPDKTFDEVRAVAQDILPGIRMRRRLFWRYTAAWTSPS